MDEPSCTADRETWLLVSQASGIGSRYFRRLLERFGSPDRILGASRGELAELGIPRDAVESLKRQDIGAIEPSLQWLRQPDHRLVTFADDAYPELLKQIDDPPPLLYLVGDVDLLHQPQLAIVGSRNPTAGGLENAREFAHTLAGAGLCITSGLATGIDGAAHEGALRAGETLAILGTGPDRIYPAAHRDLAHRIAAKGLLVSEFPPGTPARAENFPRRNRIISALSLGTLVVEAAVRSGSLITARLAAEQGREVFAIPGSIHNPNARGCHALIRQGAKLVESARDILEELAPLLSGLLAADLQDQPAASSQIQPPDPDYARLLEALGYDPVTADELIARTGLAAETVSSMLLLLELEGHVSSSPGGIYSRSAPLAFRSSGREST